MSFSVSTIHSHTCSPIAVAAAALGFYMKQSTNKRKIHMFVVVVMFFSYQFYTVAAIAIFIHSFIIRM